MKAKVSPGKLANALSAATAAAGSRLRLMDGVILRAEGEGLIVEATGDTGGAKFKIPAQVMEEGFIAVPLQRTFRLLKNVDSEQIELSANENGVRIEAGRVRVGLPAISGDCLPSFSALKGEAGERLSEAAVQAQPLRRTLRALSAIALDRHAWGWQGTVLLELREGRIRTVASDGKALLLQELPGKIQKPGGRIVIASFDARNLAVFLGKTEGEVLLEDFENCLFVSWSDTEYLIRKVDTSYPDFERVIRPQSLRGSFRANADELASSLKRAQALDARVTARLDSEEGVLRLSGESEEGSFTEILAVADAEGAGGVAISPEALLKLLRHFPAKEVVFRIQEPGMPIILEGEEGSLGVVATMAEEAEP